MHCYKTLITSVAQCFSNRVGKTFFDGTGVFDDDGVFHTHEIAFSNTFEIPCIFLLA